MCVYLLFECLASSMGETVVLVYGMTRSRDVVPRTRGHAFAPGASVAHALETQSPFESARLVRSPKDVHYINVAAAWYKRPRHRGRRLRAPIANRDVPYFPFLG